MCTAIKYKLQSYEKNHDTLIETHNQMHSKNLFEEKHSYMYVCMYACMYVCMYVRMCIYMCMCVCVCVCVCVLHWLVLLLGLRLTKFQFQFKYFNVSNIM